MAQGVLEAELIVEELIWDAPDSEFKKVLDQALDLVQRTPEILSRIEADQDAVGKTKKRLRLADQRWAEAQILDFPELTWEAGPELAAADLTLAAGRPRMAPEVTFVFLILQGYLGSVTDRQARDQLLESRTLHRYLQSRNVCMPGWNTMLENVNAVTAQTRSFILDAQLAVIREDELDDFSKVILDSTGVEANSAWPTDGRLLLGLLGRAFRASQKLQTFGLANIRRHWMRWWLKNIQKLLFCINTATGKPNSKKKRRKYYRQFLTHTRRMLEYLLPECAQRDPLKEAVWLPPSQQRLLARLWDQLLEDLTCACAVYDYTEERVFQDRQRPAREKLLSLADPAAAYIEKGGREAVIGYKPQLGRSGNGFIAALIVPEGNAADSTQLMPLVRQLHERTGVWPQHISCDDGYTNREDRDQLIADGIELVSFSGPSGKSLIPEDEWNRADYVQARRGRSAVESLMFVLKHVFEFGRLRRRGLEAVRAELLGKAIAYNFTRMVLLQARKERPLNQAA